MKNCYRNLRPSTITLIPLKEKTEIEIKLKGRDFSFGKFFFPIKLSLYVSMFIWSNKLFLTGSNLCRVDKRF